MKKETEDNYESKGGYCAVCTGLLDNGACTQHEKHEKKLCEKIKEAEQSLLTKLCQECQKKIGH